MKPSIRFAGIAILMFSVAVLALAAILPWSGHRVPGEAPACAMVMLMVGLTLVKPSLVLSKDDSQQVSAMRIAVLLVVGVFTLLTVKSGWSCTSLEQLKLDSSWAWVVIAALGGKAAQSFSESLSSFRKVADEPTPQPALPKQTKIDVTRGPSNKPGAAVSSPGQTAEPSAQA